jgi:Mrp family chromosome partitioning ATPase
LRDCAEGNAVGVMGDAFAHRKDQTQAVPVILPLSRPQPSPSAARPSPPAPAARFAFPELREMPDRPPAGRPLQATWPEDPSAESAAACANMAEGILRQLSCGAGCVAAFTSPADGDGKTSLVVALAPQLAERAQGSVLAVDLNWHKPSLAARVYIPGQPAAGLPLIYPTNLPRLSFLAAAGRPPRCLDRAWIEELRQGWSLVLLDLASLAHAEVAPLAGCCDGVYLVVRLGCTPRSAVAAAARVIRGAGGRLLGCAVVG